MCPMTKFNALPCQWQNINKYCTICWIRVTLFLCDVDAISIHDQLLLGRRGSFIIHTPLLFSLVTINKYCTICWICTIWGFFCLFVCLFACCWRLDRAGGRAVEEIERKMCKEKEREMCSGERKSQSYKFFWV